MSNDNSEFREFGSLEDLFNFVADRAKQANDVKAAGRKVTDKAMLTLDGASQRLRLKLTAMVEDPTHRLTERGFSHAMGAFNTGCETVLVSLKNTQPLTDPLILRAMIEYFSFVAEEMESQPCQCDNCQ